MDRKIYFPTQADYGKRLARRIPKGGQVPGSPDAVGAGGIPLRLNPTVVTLAFRGLNIAPHTSTLRGEYVVPVGRRATIQRGSANTNRAGAVGAGSGEHAITLGVIRRGDPATNLAYLLIATVISASITSTERTGEDQMDGPFDLFYGDKLQLHTSDNSVGGDCYYTAGIHIVEYDATEQSGSSAFSGSSFDSGGSGPGSATFRSSGHLWLGGRGIIDVFGSAGEV